MFGIKFLHTPKARKFNHKPIYWNPEAEARKEREERVNRELNGASADENFKSSITRGSFRNKRWDAPIETGDIRAERRRSNTRLLIIMAILLAIGAVFYLSL